MDLSTFSKAIGAGLAGAVIAVAARYGFHANVETATALGVILTALAGYVVGHVVVFLAPANKVTGVK